MKEIPSDIANEAGRGGKIVSVRSVGVNWIGDVQMADGRIISLRLSPGGRVKSRS